jgi:GT2 family glycosyltransferase
MLLFIGEFFRMLGPFDESFTAWGAEDNEFGYRVMNAGYYFIPVLDALVSIKSLPEAENLLIGKLGS